MEDPQVTIGVSIISHALIMTWMIWVTTLRNFHISVNPKLLSHLAPFAIHCSSDQTWPTGY